MKTYKVVKANDGTFWVPLQPLLYDLDHQLKREDIPEVAILPLESVRTFIQALIHEGTYSGDNDEKTTS